MKNNIEQLIRAQRKQMDVQEPPDRVWAGIAEALQRKQRRRTMKWSLAAGIAAAMAALLWLLPDKTPDYRPQPAAARLQQMEVYYTSLVATKRLQVNKYCGDYHELCNDFSKEIDTLNNMYQTLKAAYKETDSNEAVLNAMIGNLKEQADLLTLQLQVIRDTRKEQQPAENIL